MLERVKRLGAFFTGTLESMKKKNGLIKEIRGRGLMLGVELKKSVASDIVRLLFKRGILTNACKPDIVRFLPPFIISEKDVSFVVKNLSEVLKKN